MRHNSMKRGESGDYRRSPSRSKSKTREEYYSGTRSQRSILKSVSKSPNNKVSFADQAAFQ